MRHERAAVHAADGYARATGKVGVATVTSGPGVTNAVTGIATAYGFDPDGRDHRQRADLRHRRDAFEECDTVGITRPIVKHNFWSGRARPRRHHQEAFYIAATGRPGPVVVDIPKDVSRNACRYGIRRRSTCARTTR